MARKITLQLVGDTSSLEAAFDRARSKSGKLQGSMMPLAKSMAYATGAAGGLAIAIGVKSVNAASDLGEQINKTSVVFGKSAPVIQKWATTTAASIGISNRAALEAAGTFGNMLVPMGFARTKAADMSKRMVQLAADLASFNNASPEETLDALRAGLAGETEPLRRFGVFLSADRIKAEALSKGIVKTTKDLTKIKLATIAVDEAQQDVVKSTKKYGAQSIETQKAIAKAEYQQDQLTKALKGTVPTLTAQQKAQATYSILLSDTADAQGDFQRTSSSLPNLMRSIKASVEDLSAAFGKGLLPVVQEAAKSLQNKLANPQFRERLREIGELVGVTLLNAFKSVSAWFNRNWDTIQSGFKTAADLLRDVYDGLVKLNTVVPGGNGTMIGAILSGYLVAQVGKALIKVALLRGALAALASNPYVMTIALTFVLGAAFYKFGPEIREKILGKLGLQAGPGTGTPSLSPPPNTSGRQRARGGPVMPGTSYLVGERGTEVLTMGRQGGYVTPHGGGGIVIQNAHFHGVQNIRQLVAELERFAKHGTSQTRGAFGGQNLALG